MILGVRRVSIHCFTKLKWSRCLQTLPLNHEMTVSQLNGYREYIDKKIGSPEYHRWSMSQISLQKALDTEEIWSNSEECAKANIQLAQVLKNLKKVDDLKIEINDVLELYKMSVDDNDEDAIKECQKMITSLEEKMKKVQLLDVMTGPSDVNSCYIQILAGAGGTEACDWSLMLFEMYKNWSKLHDYSISLVDEQRDSDSGGGYRNVTLLCSGEYAYGRMKAEAGMHRLVRISPFDPTGKRHTTFAQVLVSPEIESDSASAAGEIRLSDLRIDTFRSSGAGGQSVQKTDSAVRITHLPTGIVVQCQNERSQHSNKATALKVLKSRLFLLEQNASEAARRSSTVGASDHSWGSQIRSVVMQPYQLVKDHRSGWETHNVSEYLRGDGHLLEEAIQFNLEKLFNNRGSD